MTFIKVLLVTRITASINVFIAESIGWIIANTTHKIINYESSNICGHGFHSHIPEIYCMMYLIMYILHIIFQK